MSDIGPDYWLETNYAAQLDDLSVEQHGIVKELVRAVWREVRKDARNDALEEAAKVAEHHEFKSGVAMKNYQAIAADDDADRHDHYRTSATTIKIAIRALKEGAKP